MILPRCDIVKGEVRRVSSAYLSIPYIPSIQSYKIPITCVDDGYLLALLLLLILVSGCTHSQLPKVGSGLQ